MAEEKPTSRLREPVSLDRKVLTGAQLARRLVLSLVVVVLLIVGILSLRNRFQKPIRTYYAGMEAGDTGEMSEAFPVWLVNADVAEQTMGVGDMCAAMLSLTRGTYGETFRVDVDVAEKTAVEESYLQQLATGIETQYACKVTISEGYRLRLAVTYRTSDSSETVTEYARVYRINGRWCMLDVASETA